MTKWFSRVKNLLIKNQASEQEKVAPILNPEKVSEIIITKRKSNTLSFDTWAKFTLDLSEGSKTDFEHVKATLVVNSDYQGKSWKMDPTQKAMQDLVIAAAKEVGILEGKKFYYTRSVSQEGNNLILSVDLFVLG